jgi:hypothetical protein
MEWGVCWRECWFVGRKGEEREKADDNWGVFVSAEVARLAVSIFKEGRKTVESPLVLRATVLLLPLGDSWFLAVIDAKVNSPKGLLF